MQAAALPTVVATALVLTYFFDSGISPFAMLRTFGVAVLIGVALFVATFLILREPPVAGIIATILVVGVGTTPPVNIVVGACLILTLVARGIARRTGSPLPWLRVLIGAEYLVVILLVVSSSAWALQGGPARLAADLRQGAPALPAQSSLARACCPNIYVLLLDGYPRWDTVAGQLDADDSPFLEGLEQIGFEVARSSRANYPMTSLTLPSMFNMSLLHDLPSLQEPLAAGALGPAFRDAINDNAVEDVLHRHGYITVTYSPGWEHVALRRSDVFLDDGGLNEFEVRMLQRTMIGWIVETVAPDFIGDQARARAEDAFASLTTVAVASGGPRLVFIHVPIPHPPLLYTSEGSPVRLSLEDWGDPEGYVARSEDIRAAFAGQLTYVGSRTLRALEPLVQVDSEAVVIVMSDHGARLGLAGSGPEDDRERVRNLFAARTPGQPHLFADGATLVNVFPVLFNAYLNEALPTQPDTSFKYRGDPGDPRPLPPP